MSLEFSAMHLVIGGKSPSAERLKPAFTEAGDTYSSNNVHYLIDKKNLDDKYFWLYARYGGSLPHSDTVYDTKDQKEEDNPRSVDQVEPNKQLFALYCIDSHTLYLSSTKKKSWVKEYLEERLKKAVVIKAFFKSVDEFIKKIKSVEKVKFVTKHDLYTPEARFLEIFPIPKDLLGLGVPGDYTFEANFDNVSLPQAFEGFLKRLSGCKSDTDLLLCIGRDDNNFETVFNLGSFIQKVTIRASKDEQGFYAPKIVREKLIEKIESFL